MRPGGASGRADLADHLPDMDFVADLDVDLRQVAVARGKAAAVIDLDHVAVAAVAPGNGHGAGGGCMHRLADLAAQIDAGVHRRAAEKGIETHAERRAHVYFARYRLTHGDGDQHAAQVIDLCASDVDAIELTVKGAGARPWCAQGHEWPAGGACGRHSTRVDAEIAEYALNATCLRVDVLLERTQRRRLLVRNLVELLLNPCQDTGQAAAIAERSKPCRA